MPIDSGDLQRRIYEFTLDLTQERKNELHVLLVEFACFAVRHQMIDQMLDGCDEFAIQALRRLVPLKRGEDGSYLSKR